MALPAAPRRKTSLELRDVVARVHHLEQLPDKKIVKDDDDDVPFARHVYAGEIDDIKGSTRLMIWGPGEVPKNWFDEYNMDLFPNISELATSEIGRLCVRSNLRGKLVVPSIVSFIYDYMAGEQGTDLNFSVCRPTLLKYYRKLGARPYGARLHPMEFGLAIPLVYVMSDYDYFDSVDAITTSNVKKHFGRGKRPPLDMTPFEHLFAADNRQIEISSGRVLQELEDRLSEAGDEAPKWMGALPPKVLEMLAQAGFLLDVKPGDVIIQEGMAERELYVIIDGSAEVLQNDKQLTVLGPGAVMGEMAFFREAGLRTATVRAVEPTRVLVLRYKFLQELKKKDPDAAFSILFHLGQSLADRLHEATRSLNS